MLPSIHVHQPEVTASVGIFVDGSENDDRLGVERFMQSDESWIGDEKAPPFRHASESAS
jgi:hypothetical protein